MSCDFMILGVVSVLLLTATVLVIQFFSDIRKVENQLKKKEIVFTK
ncbi:MAG: hypothetical protein R3321_13905 [Nitrososphaeraceae archaeon]|nr:hypothetical protein [Nitrososphaeraceae archaeon]